MKFKQVWVLLTSVVMTVALLASLAVSSADAAEITDAITDVDIAQTSSTIFSTLDFSVDWMVPNGSVAGDFFTIELPPELDIPDSFTFDLTDANGNVVAVATVNNGVITFTLTSFVEGMNNISGTAFLMANMNQNLIEDGQDNDFTFVSANGSFTDTVFIQELLGFPNSLKFVRLLDEPNAACLLYTSPSPRDS